MTLPPLPKLPEKYGIGIDPEQYWTVAQLRTYAEQYGRLCAEAERAALSAEPAQSQTCIECGGPLQWRCPTCRIAQSAAVAEPAHTDHPVRHWDRTCPACNASIDYSAEPAQEMTDEQIDAIKKSLTWWNGSHDMTNHRSFARAVIAADRASRLPEIPSGWKITQDDKRPFKCIEISAPNGYVARVMSHERNPSNVLYMLAEALLRGEKT